VKPNTSNKRTLTAKKGRKTEGKKIKLESPQSFQEKLKLNAQELKVLIEKNVLEKQEEQELAAPPLNQFLFNAVSADPNFDPYINNLEMSFIEGMKDNELKDKPTNSSSPGTQTL